MGNYKDIFRDEGKRLVVAIPCFLLGIGIALSVDAYGLLFALPFFLAAGIIMAPLISAFAAEPLRGLFYSGERFDRPQPMYGQPLSKRAWGLYEEAIAGFEKIAREYPGEL
jgi:hypothetical protein